MQLTVAVYGLTQEFPRDELYGLISQIRRAAVSMPGNLAEGHGRLGTNEDRQFLGIARASNYAVQTQLARRLDDGDSKSMNEARVFRTK